MNELASTLAEKITARSEPFSADDDSLLLAHEIIAKVRTNGFKPCDHRVDSGEFDDEDVQMLRDALLDYSRAHSDHPTRGAAYWGLAALHDARELGFLRELLQQESTHEAVDEEILWQIMIGLDNIGEDVLRPIEEDPVEQAGDRWAVARLYLSRHT